VEDERNNPVASGVTRGQNQLHVMPEDWSAAAGVIEPLLTRGDGSADAPYLLIVTNDAEAAAGVAGRLANAVPTTTRILAATDARRAIRALRSAPAHIIAGPPRVLLELLQSALLKPDGLRAIVLAWVESLDGASARALETFMADLPKEAARYVFASEMTTEAEALVERYAWRARRMQPGEAEPPVSLSYIATSEAGRLATLRRVLDAVDPATAAVVVPRESSRAAVRYQLRVLGYGEDAGDIRVVDRADAGAELVILYELPPSEAELRRTVRGAGAARVIALATARQVGALRRSAGGALTPFVLPAAAERARTQESALREELRQALETGQYARELLALEPLLSEYDGTEIAAAALRLLEAERTRRPAATASPAPAAMTRLFINVGEMDDVKPADLVGAIMNETGISRSELGRVDVRERFSTAEVAPAVAETVVAKLTGIVIRGRRAQVRLDEGRERRDAPERRNRGERSDRPDRRDRPTRPRPPRR
jgi:ATP-dependent RNA helicase DeaD